MTKRHLTFATCHLPFAILFAVLLCRPLQAIQITGVSLTNLTINAETLTTVGNTTATAVNFTLDNNADVSVFIQDATNPSSTTVAVLTQNFSAAGPEQIPWSALWLLGNDLGRKDGTFSFSVVATSGTDTSALTSAQLLKITSVDIHNLNVIPSLDANNNTAFPFLIQYALAKPALVTVAVANSTGTVIRTLINRKLQVGETISTVTVTWDGLDANGRASPLGLYTITVDATDTVTGDHAIQRVRSLPVQSLAGAGADAQKTFEENVFVFPNPVRNGQANFNIVPVRDGATIHLRIYTITGGLVFDQDVTSQIPLVPWTVTNQAGRKLGRGLYYYVVREDDSLGTLQTTKKMAILP